MKKATVLLAVFLIAAIGNLAEAKTFTLDDPKGVNSILFLLDSRLEPIMGVSQGIGGTIDFDPEHPEKTSGTITVAAEQITTPNKKMTSVLHSEDWLNIEKYPTVTYEIQSVDKVDREDNEYVLYATGAFTLKGVTKEIPLEVKVTYLEDELGKRVDGKSGDLLVIRTTFTIDRNDFNIKKGMGNAKVADIIELRVAVSAYHEE